MQGIFIYGGCVVRDAYEKIREKATLTGYVSRQSLISATTPASKLLPEAKLASAFQARSANGDIQSNLLREMAKAAPTTDLFVMDFHIERLGIYKLSDGSFITPSSEIMRSGVLKSLEVPPGQVLLGTERHLAFWTHAARRFNASLIRLGIQDKVLVVNAPWATHDSDGKAFGLFKGKPVAEVSHSISGLTHILAGHGLNVVTMPKEYSVSPIEHRWGSGPYHFGESAMDWVSGQMIQALN